MKKTKSAGFTLIELVMVIVVIGIVSTVALPKFTNLSGVASSAAVAENTSSIHTAFSAHVFKAAAGNPGSSVSGQMYPTIHALVAGNPDGGASQYKISPDFAYGIPKIVAASPSAACESYRLQRPDFGPQTTMEIHKEENGAYTCYYDGVSATAAFPMQRVLRYEITPQEGMPNFSGPTPLEACAAYGQLMAPWAVATAEESPYNDDFACYYNGDFYTSAEPVFGPLAPTSLPGLTKPLRVALDGSGICVGKGMRLPTWKNSDKTIATTATSSQIYAISDKAVPDDQQCPEA